VPAYSPFSSSTFFYFFFFLTSVGNGGVVVSSAAAASGSGVVVAAAMATTTGTGTTDAAAGADDDDDDSPLSQKAKMSWRVNSMSSSWDLAALVVVADRTVLVLMVLLGPPGVVVNCKKASTVPCCTSRRAWCI
jgi:hypothetical protein